MCEPKEALGATWIGLLGFLESPLLEEEARLILGGDEEDTETGFRIVDGLTTEGGSTAFTSETNDLSGADFWVCPKAGGSSLMESTGTSSNTAGRGVYAGVSESEDEEAVETSIS